MTTLTGFKAYRKFNKSMFMDILLTVVSLMLIITGVLVMLNYKFYKYDTSDTLFATKLKVFLSGLLFSLIGVYVLVNELITLFK
ncbi:hypothetical protein GCM10027443_17670 [Pontibacter brevis]